jgi:hypothetical protein
MKVRVIATLVLAVCLGFGSASASSIGVFFDTGAARCDALIPAQFTQVTWYVMAILGGDIAADGITGAEFSLKGVPPAWFAQIFANPAANVDLRHPMGIGVGTNIAFPACQKAAPVLLYTYQVLATSVPANGTYLTVERHDFPSSPSFQCPLLVICDPPIFTKVCVRGGQGILNGDPSGTPPPVPCTVGVDQTNWSTVKSLYNN